ncbi:hypothetical protein WS68_19560 [Burkholderia sp. TSV86]|nr:hypothetical protein WS68_19560 [Burkholderia sp. TSV86]
MCIAGMTKRRSPSISGSARSGPMRRDIGASARRLGWAPAGVPARCVTHRPRMPGGFYRIGPVSFRENGNGRPIRPIRPARHA